MKSPRDQEIVSWWGGGKVRKKIISPHHHHEIISWSLGDKLFSFIDLKTFSPRDQEIVLWWGWGKRISSSQDFFHNETTRLSRGGDGVREIFISSKIQRNP